jgi:hypothetical protein
MDVQVFQPNASMEGVKVLLVINGCHLRNRYFSLLCSKQSNNVTCVPEPVRKPLSQRVRRNVLTRMKNATGPLSLLWDCMERRVRIKVCVYLYRCRAWRMRFARVDTFNRTD